jgi:hypothetical protein
MSALQFLLALTIVGVSSCSHARPVGTNSQHAYVRVAAVDNYPGSLTNWISALVEAGIPYLAEGSSIMVITVPADKKSRAAEILKRDAQVHNYDATFY